MTNKTTAALKLAEEHFSKLFNKVMMQGNLGHQWTGLTLADGCSEALVAVREVLAEQSMAMILNDPHPPHRLCECTACLEYWTPLPDCDAFAGGGKPIDHIADTGKLIAEPVQEHESREDIAAKEMFEGFSKAWAAPVKQEPVMDYERFTALREGEQNRAEDDYFNARPHNDTPTLRGVFCQGFDRGFNKGLKYAAPVDAKAIRAEALEEAAKRCEKRIGGAVQNNEWWSGFKAAMKQCAAAIRWLK